MAPTSTNPNASRKLLLVSSSLSVEARFFKRSVIQMVLKNFLSIIRVHTVSGIATFHHLYIVTWEGLGALVLLPLNPECLPGHLDASLVVVLPIPSS
jgi:hypothetical protein